jgi:hypothetical protein
MSLSCSTCSRQITRTAGEDAPLFCMYCGQKLRSTVPDGDATQLLPAPLRNLLKLPDSQLDFASTRTISPAEATEATVEDSVAPTQVAGYRLLRFIGGGGMGNVYEAISSESGERVAVKLLSKKLAGNPSSNERFRQEGRLASQIMHPRCVFVIRADTDNGRPFIVMELMPGQTLKDIVDQRGPMPVAQAVASMLDVVEGLIEAHRMGVIHRDVKPSNCFVDDDGRVKIGDFGLSKSLTGEQPDKQLTGSGTFLGTVLFAAPEQIKHEPVGYDSDVYAVCATLYYLLIGRAPHQHESLTAVLAKVISEPAPSLRATRSEVPLALEKIILKGLERDRTRRYCTLEELQSALQDQVPSAQTPARLRVLVVAYLVDFFLLQLLYGALELLLRLGFRLPYNVEHPILSSWPHYIIVFGYFILLEGLFGATLGKRLMRLRVRRLGECGPPGLAWAALRTLVYNAIWAIPPLFLLVCLILGLPKLGWWLSGLGWLVTALLLLMQIRRTALGYRGLHDFASGTRTVAQALPPRSSAFVSQQPAPLEHTITSSTPLPSTVGMFDVRGKLCDVDDGGEIWLGEDSSLGRRVLVRLEPSGTGDDSLYDEPIVRPSRLRAVGHGLIRWNNADRAWVAYVAPTGAPLTDIVSPTHPIAWADAAGLIDQLVQELVEGEADFSNPPMLTTEQVWVEPNGRVQLLDFPIPTGHAVVAGETRSRYPRGTADAAKFLKQCTTLMLEGRSRAGKQPIAAPLPPKAGELLAKLLENDDPKLTEFRNELKSLREQAQEVSVSQRVAQVSAQGVLMSLGLVIMMMLAGLMNFFITFGVLQFYKQCGVVRTAIDTREQREALLATAREKWTTPKQLVRLESLEKTLNEENVATTLESLDQVVDHEAVFRQKMNDRLNPIERIVLQAVDVETGSKPKLDQIAALLTSNEIETRNDVQFRVNGKLVNQADRRIEEIDQRMMEAFTPAAITIMVWPLVVWPAFAFLFRGGVAYVLSGISIVRKSGRRAARWRIALRCLLAWLPFSLVLLICLYVQLMWPEAVAVRTGLLIVALLMLPMMMVMALRNPTRGPHDKLLGTYLVPN